MLTVARIIQTGPKVASDGVYSQLTCIAVNIQITGPPNMRHLLTHNLTAACTTTTCP